VVNHRDVEGEDVDLANWRETHGFCHKLCMELVAGCCWHMGWTSVMSLAFFADEKITTQFGI